MSSSAVSTGAKFMLRNRFTQLFSPPLQSPIIGAGMVWCSGWKLATAVSKKGGLGLLGSGSMYPDVLIEHIHKCQEALSIGGQVSIPQRYTFGVNLPVMNKYADQHIETCIREKVPVVVTSAGNPKKYTKQLKEQNILVGHVVGSSKFAFKAIDAGCDFIVAEGFEAGGHNSREETTTMVLIRDILKYFENANLPKPIIIAAGGIGCGQSMFACMSLGAEGVQIGSRFVVAEESSCHENFKDRIIEAKEGDTFLSIKKVVPVRLLANTWAKRIQEADFNGANKDTLKEMLGIGRSRIGMFEGDMEEGELEIGQVSSLISKKNENVNDIMDSIHCEFKETVQNVAKTKLGLSEEALLYSDHGELKSKL